MGWRSSGKSGDRPSYERYLKEVRELTRRHRNAGRPETGASGEDTPPLSGRQELVEANLMHVINIARDYSGLGIPFEDLMSEGNVGLLEAAERFDPDRRVKFITYAAWWIRKRIFNLISRQISMVRLPKYKLERLRRLRSADARLRTRLGRQPTTDELSAESDLTEGEIRNLRLVGQKSLSLEHVVHDDSGQTLEDTVPGDGAWQAENDVIEENMETAIAAILRDLPAKERLVVRYRYGFDRSPPETLQSIADRLGLSRERVRQIELRALDRIRKTLHRRPAPLAPSAPAAESPRNTPRTSPSEERYPATGASLIR